MALRLGALGLGLGLASGFRVFGLQGLGLEGLGFRVGVKVGGASMRIPIS